MKNLVSKFAFTRVNLYRYTSDEKEEAFEPFNLKSEREEGYFDDDGNYVEYKVGLHSCCIGPHSWTT